MSGGERPIPHKVIFDQAEALLASRLAAFLLEPKALARHGSDVAQCLDLLAALRRANGGRTALGQATNLLKWAEQSRQGKKSKAALAVAADMLIAEMRKVRLTGNPEKDWLLIKRTLRESNAAEFVTIAGHLDYLIAFNRGRRIASNLSALWTRSGCSSAREALDDALAEDQIMAGVEDLTGVHVMTIHRSKGSSSTV